MATTLITRDIVKQHLRVTHDASDDLIDHILNVSITHAQNYLNRKFYLTDAEITAAVTAGEIESEERGVVLTETMNGAIALLCEYRYYGVSAIEANKFKEAAENDLHHDRYIVGW